jgi:hypothetical protein
MIFKSRGKEKEQALTNHKSLPWKWKPHYFLDGTWLNLRCSQTTLRKAWQIIPWPRKFGQFFHFFCIFFQIYTRKKNSPNVFCCHRGKIQKRCPATTSDLIHADLFVLWIAISKYWTPAKGSDMVHSLQLSIQSEMAPRYGSNLEWQLHSFIQLAALPYPE